MEKYFEEFAVIRVAYFAIFIFSVIMEVTDLMMKIDSNDVEVCGVDDAIRSQDWPGGHSRLLCWWNVVR